jgi:hypothetical protein
LFFFCLTFPKVGVYVIYRSIKFREIWYGISEKGTTGVHIEHRTSHPSLFKQFLNWKVHSIDQCFSNWGPQPPREPRGIEAFKKNIFYIIEPLKNWNKLVTKNTNQWYIGKPTQKFPIHFVVTENFWISLQYQSHIFFQVKEFCLFCQY